jgi:hypothetical protein
LRCAAALVLAALAASCGGDGGGPRRVDFAWFEPARWEGAPVRETDLARYVEGGLEALPTPSKVVLFRYTCDHCAAHFAELAARPPAAPLVLVHVPDEPAGAVRVVERLPEHALLLALEVLDRGYGVTAPVTFDVDGQGIVRDVRGRDD